MLWLRIGLEQVALCDGQQQLRCAPRRAGARQQIRRKRSLEQVGCGFPDDIRHIGRLDQRRGTRRRENRTNLDVDVAPRDRRDGAASRDDRWIEQPSRKHADRRCRASVSVPSIWLRDRAPCDRRCCSASRQMWRPFRRSDRSPLSGVAQFADGANAVSCSRFLLSRDAPDAAHGQSVKFSDRPATPRHRAFRNRSPVSQDTCSAPHPRTRSGQFP